jgi:hypothetical protein
MRIRVSKRGLAAVTVLGLAAAAVEAYVLCPEARGACVGPLAWAGADDWKMPGPRALLTVGRQRVRVSAASASPGAEVG